MCDESRLHGVGSDESHKKAEVGNSEPLEPPVVSWIPEESAGGDTWMNKGEYAAGFSVKVTSTKPGTVYVVPSGTPRDKAQIELTAMGSAVVPIAVRTLGKKRRSIGFTF
ncbi:hypothetical protein [uncultured Brevibacillus sp.]|uniref:hypothetical protein n=1 Tax=uncultured Brevibacillus sp. TaxID=169970 RepID=UPI002595D7F3|nr:hypothetical protein [uncultured Brevibacillus sp.]